MLKKIGIFLMVFACGLFLSKVWAQGVEDVVKDVHIKVKTGVHGAGVDAKTKVKVGEYDVLNTGANPNVDWEISGRINNAYFSGGGNYYEDEDQAYHANIDMQRYVTTEFEYWRFWHWLDHDPLTNLYAAKTNKLDAEGKPANAIPPYVTYTDLQVGREYGIMRSEMQVKNTLRVPTEKFLTGLPIEIKPFFNYRKEVRRGERQALTMSKCSACHVVSTGKRVNEYIKDYVGGFVATHRNRIGRFTVSYEYLDRKFGENAVAPENYYDIPAHPGSGDYKFGEKILYSGKHPYSELPRSRKWSHIAKLNAYFPSFSTGVFTNGIVSRTQNKNTGNRFNLKSIFSRLSNSMIPGLALNVHFRWLDLSNENVYKENKYEHSGLPYGTANPYSGIDGKDAYTYSRESAMSRDEWEVGFDSAYLLMPGVTLRGSYRWRQISRDLDDLYTQGDDDTEEHMAKVGVNARHRLPFNLSIAGRPILRLPITARLIYRYESIAHPFANVNGVYTGSTTGMAGSTYKDFHNMRDTTVTNQPTRRDDIRFDITLPIMDNLSLTAFYRWKKEENDLANGWRNWSHEPSVSLWYAPSLAEIGIPGSLSLTGSFLFRHGKTSSLLVEPIYDG